MQFKTIIVALFATAALAAPSDKYYGSGKDVGTQQPPVHGGNDGYGSGNTGGGNNGGNTGGNTGGGNNGGNTGGNNGGNTGGNTGGGNNGGNTGGNNGGNTGGGNNNNGGNTGGNGGGNGGSNYSPCPDGLFSNAQCCATSVLDLADLNCNGPSSVPTSAENFSQICAATGSRARCCVLPVAGQSVLCQDPVGVRN